MKFRNNWNIASKQWDKIQIKIRLGKIDLLTFEADFGSKFYKFTLLNFTIKTK